MKAAKLVLRILNILLIFVLVLLLAVNIYVIVVRAVTGHQPTVFGWSSAVVISGSMTGSLEVNDQVIAQRMDEYQKGDIIVFDTGLSLVTHRIHEVTENGFVTKGDANNTPDQDLVQPEQVLGKVVWVIPQAGVIIGYLRTPSGILSLMMIGALLVGAPVLLKRQNGEKS